MTLPQPALAHPHHARDLAACLADAADRLDAAAGLPEFLAAVEAHRRVWHGVRRAASWLGHVAPPELVEFSLSAAGRARRRLDGHEVEALILIDRFVSAAIVKRFPPEDAELSAPGPRAAAGDA